MLVLPPPVRNALCRRSLLHHAFLTPSTSTSKPKVLLIHTTPVAHAKRPPQTPAAALEELQKRNQRMKVPTHTPTSKPRRNHKINLPLVALLDPTTHTPGPLQPLDALIDAVSPDGFVVELVSEHPVPTVRLVDLKESRAQTLKERMKEKRMASGPRQEVQKEAHLTWFMGEADEAHKLSKVREDLEKGGCKVDVVFLTKKRQRPPPKEEMLEKLNEVAESLEDVAKQWKPYNVTNATATLFLQSKARMASAAASVEELKEMVPKHIQTKEERRARAEKHRQQREEERLRAEELLKNPSAAGELWGV